jgi:2-dehydro-3-deoxyphosphogluconate aldolase/(4S)-4-hydroxy-2-oxoglutarate aldolase
VLTADQARAAVDAGASFLVTPALGRSTDAVLTVGRDAGVPVLAGALTPTEVLAAMDLGADVVKIFPASVGGPRYLADLRGPFPGVPLVPSGGITAESAGSFLDAGALAVSAGTSVVPPHAVAGAEWARITEAARAFRTAVGSRAPSS